MDNKPKTVTEYVVYRGAFDDNEHRQPVLSTPDLELARHARLNELHDAHIACKPDAVFSIGQRVCTYPTDAKGKAQSHGSTVEETEVT